MDRIVRYILVGDSSAAVKAFQQTAAAAQTAGAKLDATGRKVEAFGRRVSGIGRSMMLLSGSIIGVGVVAGRMAVNFQSAMEQVHTQAGASQKEVDALSGKVLNLAKTLPQGPQELAAGLYHLESIGLRGARAMDALKIAAQGAAVGNSDLEETATALGSAYLVDIKGAGNLRNVMGLLNATVGAGNMRMGDLVEALGTGILPAAKTAGLGIKDVLGALAIFTDEGYQASSAAAQLGTALHFLYQPTAKAQGALAKINLSGAQLAADMRKPNGLLVALTDLRNGLATLPGGATGIAAEQTLGAILPGGRGRILLTLINQLDRYQGKLNQIGHTSGGFNGAVQKALGTDANRFKSALSSLQVALIQLGAAILPVAVPMFEKLASGVGALTSWFMKLPKPVRSVALALAAILAVAAPVLIVIGGLITAVGAIIGALGLLAPAIGAVGGALMFLAMNPAFLVLAALTAIGIGLYEAYTHSKTFRKVVDTAASAVAKAFKWMWKEAGPVLTFLGNKIKWVTDKAGALIKFFNVTAPSKVVGFLGHLVPHFHAGGIVPHFATGGVVAGAGGGDTVPAMLSPGEGVLRKRVVSALGPSGFAALNAGMVPVAGPDVIELHHETKLDGRTLAESVTHYQLKRAAVR